MKLMPKFIPRFNLDYNFNDFWYGIISSFTDLREDAFNLTPLERLFGKRTFLFTNSGRSSLYVILRALNLPKGSKIGVPLYSCTVVFDAIQKAGYVPRFIDIDLDNYTIAPEDLKEKMGDLEAVVVIHTYGRPADMDKIKKVAGDKPVIEDCAHSLLSEYKNQLTGTLGDAAFFSLSKYISAGEGGMVILNNTGYKERIETEVASLAAVSKLSELKHSLFVYLYSFLYHRPWYGMFAFSLGSYIENHVDIAGKRTFSVSKIGNSDLAVFIRKLATFRAKVELQRKNSQTLLKELENTDLILPYERRDTWCNYFMFPVLFGSKEERDNAHTFLRKMGVDTAKLWCMTPSTARRFYGYKGDCPNTEDFVDRVLIIPIYYTLSDKELFNIYRVIKNFCKLIR